MKVEKIINNNIVSSRDDSGEEIVVMGKGIGFQVKKGQEIQPEKIEKIFKMDNQDMSGQLQNLLKALPMEHVQISSEIIEYADSVLQRRLNQNIYITLTDHISFSIERYKDGMKFQNPILWEIKSFYPSEYLIGEYAVALIDFKLGIKFTEDEAASIALHIVNAEYNTGMSNTMNIMVLIQAIIEIVKEQYPDTLDEISLHYSRFVTHLKFLAQRIFTSSAHEHEIDELDCTIKNLYPNEYQCSMKVANYIEENYHQHITSEEITYLAIHIHRIQKI